MTISIIRNKKSLAISVDRSAPSVARSNWIDGKYKYVVMAFVEVHGWVSVTCTNRVATGDTRWATAGTKFIVVDIEKSEVVLSTVKGA